MASSDLDLLLLGDESIEVEGDRYGIMRETMNRIFDLGWTAQPAVKQAWKQWGVADYIGADGIVFPHRPSLALAQLATVATSEGYRVAVVDNVLRYEWRRRQAEQIITTMRPGVIGITTTFLMTAEVVTSFVTMVREMAPWAKIVIGGPTARRLPELHGVADYCVIGAGERPLLDILRMSHDGGDPSSIPHIALRRDDGKVVYGPQAAETALIGIKGSAFRARSDETIPHTDWTLYSRSRENVYPIELSRGCKYNCYYCSYDRGKTVRHLADVKAELEQNAKIGIRKYRISDSNFTDGPPSSPRYPHEVCAVMSELDLGLEWSCYSRVDDLTDELARFMRQAGCFAVFFGIESGDDKMLTLMRKGHTVADAAHGIQVAKRNGLFAHANFICGYPGETRESFERTLNFIQVAEPDSVTIAKFFLEEHVPVSGAGMSNHQIRGYGTKWTHSTMDSDEADTLIREGLERLMRGRVVLGNEYQFAHFKSYGIATDDIKRLLWEQRDFVDSQPNEPYRVQLERLYMHQMPTMLASDDQYMRGMPTSGSVMTMKESA